MSQERALGPTYGYGWNIEREEAEDMLDFFRLAAAWSAETSRLNDILAEMLPVVAGRVRAAVPSALVTRLFIPPGVPPSAPQPARIVQAGVVFDDGLALRDVTCVLARANDEDTPEAHAARVIACLRRLPSPEVERDSYRDGYDNRRGRFRQ